MLLNTIKIYQSNWFYKTLIDQHPGRMNREGDQTRSFLGKGMKNNQSPARSTSFFCIFFYSLHFNAHILSGFFTCCFYLVFIFIFWDRVSLICFETRSCRPGLMQPHRGPSVLTFFKGFVDFLPLLWFSS